MSIFELLTRLLELAAQASLEKRVFLEKLLARGEAGALALLAMRHDKEPFLPLSWTAHAICPIGLAEMVASVIGEPLDASHEAQDFAAHVVAHLQTESERLSAKHKVRFVLAESRDITAPHRLARLDRRAFGEDTIPSDGKTVDPAEIYYTNSVKLPVTSRVESFERFRIEGALQAGSVYGTTSDVWLGASLPAPDRLAVLISRAFYQTQVAAITFSPEFTVCTLCRTVSRGRHAACPQCGASRVDVLAQATNRYSRTSTWPRWKLAELSQRQTEVL